VTDSSVSLSPPRLYSFKMAFFLPDVEEAILYYYQVSGAYQWCVALILSSYWIDRFFDQCVRSKRVAVSLHCCVQGPWVKIEANKSSGASSSWAVTCSPFRPCTIARHVHPFFLPFASEHALFLTFFCLYFHILNCDHIYWSCWGANLIPQHFSVV